MKRFVKILSVVMCLAMLCTAFAGCGGKADGNTTAADGATAAADSGKVYNVGVIQLTQHIALDAATQGFKDALTEKLGDKVSINVQNAAGEPATCATMAQQFVANGVDLIMANASPALSAAASATADIPIVATSITDYPTALDIPAADWTGKTGFNVTGTSDLAPLDQQAEMILELFPEVKTVGIIYCSGEANSKYQVEAVTKALTEKGVTVKDYSFADSNDIAAVTTKAVAECDVLYSPTDNKVADFGETINNIAEPAGIPLIAGEEGICKKCGVATLSIDYYDIGYEAGLMAYEILVNGANPGDMEIGYAKEFTKEYMKDRAAALEVAIPEDYKEIEA